MEAARVLTDADIEALADAIADRLAGVSPAQLVDAATVARELGVSRAYVYEHAEKLGARRLSEVGEGKRPRLRFDLAAARAAFRATEAPEPTRAPQRLRKTATRSSAELLPIRGRAE